MGDFVHLHVHSEYSLLDGAARIKDIIRKAKDLGQKAIAITDHGAMYGVIDFYNEAVKQGIKPVLGFEAYAVQDMTEKTTKNREYGHLILIARNEKGYKNLMQLCTIGFLEGYYYKPRIDYDTLEKYSEGIICTSACVAGDIPQLLLQGQKDEAYALAMRLKRIFGDDFYIEIQNHGIADEIRVMPMLIELARTLDIKIVATNDCHYVEKEDASAQDILMSLQMGKTLADGGGLFEKDEFYIKSTEEMEKLFDFIPEALENTVEIADKCDIYIEQGIHLMPRFDIPEGFTNVSYLEHLVEEGMKNRYGSEASSHAERVRYELDTIISMGFTDYFLIVWDYINFSKENGIMVGPGRGSAAGSIVAYALGITDIDPIKYNLLFERFLNPERVSMPDIDTDFCIERRGEVIDYVASKYGQDHVAQLVTFGTLGAKQVVKDVARVMGIPLAESNRVAKMVPFGVKTIEEALDSSPMLKTEYDSSEDIKEWLDTCMKIEGMPRQTSTHAAAVVISAKPITEYSPLCFNKKDESVMTQYNMHNIEDLGLLKMDFLGLRTLTVIRDTLRMVKQNTGRDIDIQKIDFDDKAVYDLISSGETDGIFQLESDGMRSLMTRMKPGSLGDVMVGIALFRPGPMAKIPEYIEAKNNHEKVHYDHPILENILKDTYGCMVYQEQVMEIVRDMAGYSLGRSDEVRRAMAKKKKDVMEKERKIFVYGGDGIEGAIKRGVPEKVAQSIFDQMMDFAQYAFNKSHACAYAFVTYQTAYLKKYYPTEFMTAIINSFIATADKVSHYMRYVKKIGIEILPPDINRSSRLFEVENGRIRFGLAALINVGDSIEDVIEERQKNGAYRDFREFIERNVKSINKTQLESLILSGAFDSMGYRRSQLMAAYPKMLKKAQDDEKNAGSGQMSLFALAGPAFEEELDLPDIPEYDEKYRLTLEKQKLGMYLSGHPLSQYEKDLQNEKWTVEKIMSDAQNPALQENMEERLVDLAGIFTIIKSRTTRRTKQVMADAVFEDLTGTINVLIFPQVYEKYSQILETDEIMRIKARVSITEEVELLLDSVESYVPRPPREKAIRGIRIILENEDISKIRAIKDIVSAHGADGKTALRVHINSTGKDYALKPISVDDSLMERLVADFGPDNIQTLR